MSSFPESMPIDHFIFRAGQSASDTTEQFSRVESTLKEIGFGQKNIYMDGITLPGSSIIKRTLGIAVSDDVLRKFGFSEVGSSLAHMVEVDHTQRSSLHEMLKFEGIKTGIEKEEKSINLLVFGKEFKDQTHIRAAKTALHEIGHAVSSRTVQDSYDFINDSLVQNVANFRDSLEDFENEALKMTWEEKKAIAQKNIPDHLKEAGEEFQDSFIDAMRAYGKEEARAESFSGLLSKTRIGRSITKNDVSDLLTGYHSLETDYRPFKHYSESHFKYVRQSLGYNKMFDVLNLHRVLELGEMAAHGTFMGSLNYRWHGRTYESTFNQRTKNS